jgi:hypothetical protein
LNDDGRSDYAVSINENFYVTKSGAAGGGSGSFGSGNVGGFSSSGSGGSVNGHLSVNGDITCGTLAASGSVIASTGGSVIGNLYDYALGDIAPIIKQLQEDVKLLFSDMANHTHTVTVEIGAHTHGYKDRYGLVGGSSSNETTGGGGGVSSTITTSSASGLG